MENEPIESLYLTNSVEHNSWKSNCRLTRKNIFPNFIERERSVPHSEPDEPSPHLPTAPLRHILILFSYLCVALLSCLFPSGFQTKILYALGSQNIPNRSVVLLSLQYT
jgi:hypothetical protein